VLDIEPWIMAIALAGLIPSVLVAWLIRRRPWRGPRTRYPVVLAHGMLGFTAIGVGKLKQDYFRHIADHLRALGLEVHQPRVPAVASIAERAQVLADAVRELPAARVNIIAHSMGGLDARYAISRLGLKSRVATLVTIGAPHRGTPIADAGKAVLGKRLRLDRIIKGVGLRAFFDLTTSHLERFNAEVTNVRGVRYACVIASTPGSPHPLLLPTHTFLREKGHASDGLVPESSQRWGRVIARIDADHWAQIGWSSKFDAPRLYERIAHRLRAWRC
jgi:triacylglycerol lipase